MEHIPPKGKSLEAFTEDFVIKKNDVPKVSREPTYITMKPVLDVVDKNLIGMLYDQDNIYRKLHLVSNTSQLAGGPAQ